MRSGYIDTATYNIGDGSPYRLIGDEGFMWSMSERDARVISWDLRFFELEVYPTNYNMMHVGLPLHCLKCLKML